MFIKFYPVMFPEDQDNQDENFKDLILHLLIKEPLQRLGSDSFENELHSKVRVKINLKNSLFLT